MSRSYKKYPCWSAPDSGNGIHSGVHHAKALANRKVRRPWHWDIPSGGAYKRVSDSWDIRDYKSVYHTKARVLRCIEENNRELAGDFYPHQYPMGITLRYREYHRKYSLMCYYYAK